jgi:peptide/nickel transport system substrate-binding protein
MLARMCGRVMLLALAVASAMATWPPALAEAQRQQAPSETAAVRIPLAQYDGSMTPYTFERAYPFVMLVYDTLLWRDAQGVPQPWLARSVQRSDGGRRLTIELAEGVRWHDGEPLTAADVAFTFEFAREHTHPRFSPQLRDLESIQATDRDTVVIDLRRPSLGFLDQPLADLPILPKHLWEGLEPDRLAPPGLAVGSGPYRLVAQNRREGYQFRANTRYFLGRPTVDTIGVPIMRDARSTLAALDEGNVDMVPVSLPPQMREGLEGLGLEISTGASYLGTVLMFNLRQPPFDRVEVRRAVASALDLPRIAGAVGGIGGPSGAVASRRGYLHPASRWAPRQNLHAFDEDAARQALQRLNLPPLRLLAPDNDPVQLEAGRQVVLALRRAGVQAQLAELPVETLDEAVGARGADDADDADDPDEAVAPYDDADDAKPTFQLAIWSAPPLASYDPDFLRAVFGAEAPLNLSGYDSTRFAELAAQVARSGDEASRRAAVLDELRLLAGEAPVVPLFFQEGAFGFRPAAYDGWVYVKGSGILDKRSFLPGGPARAQPVRSDGSPSSNGSDSLPVGGFGLSALGLATVAIGVLTWGWLRRRG